MAYDLKPLQCIMRYFGVWWTAVLGYLAFLKELKGLLLDPSLGPTTQLTSQTLNSDLRASGKFPLMFLWVLPQIKGSAAWVCGSFLAKAAERTQRVQVRISMCKPRSLATES